MHNTFCTCWSKSYTNDPSGSVSLELCGFNGLTGSCENVVLYRAIP